MRLAPVVIASVAAGNSLTTTMQISAISGRETRYSKLAEEATAMFGGLLNKAVSANDKNELLRFDNQENLNNEVLATIQQAEHKTESALKPTGYVIKTLEIAV